MPEKWSYLVPVVLLCVLGSPAMALDHPPSYVELWGHLAAEDRALRQQGWRGRAGSEALEQKLLGQIDRLFQAWNGSRWGLGMPQSTRPHLGKTNCGLFVAVVLRDAGFRLPIWKFNRQASYHAIRSLAPRYAIR